MRLNRRDFSAALLSTALFGRTLADAKIAAPMPVVPTEGVHFERKAPTVPVATGTLIEVIEFFSYACPHCLAFETPLEAWVSALPKDVAFRRVPVPFIGNAAALQRLYFALEVEGHVEALQAKVFTAVQPGPLMLESQRDVDAFAISNGIDASSFMRAYKSQRVSDLVAGATAAVRRYELGSVPTLAVQGRFLTSPAQAGSAENALKTTDYLIESVRRG